MEGKKELVVRLLEHRFGALSGKQRALVEAGDLTQLDAWADRLLDARDLAELLGED